MASDTWGCNAFFVRVSWWVLFGRRPAGTIMLPCPVLPHCHIPFHLAHIVHIVAYGSTILSLNFLYRPTGKPPFIPSSLHKFPIMHGCFLFELSSFVHELPASSFFGHGQNMYISWRQHYCKQGGQHFSLMSMPCCHPHQEILSTASCTAPLNNKMLLLSRLVPWLPQNHDGSVHTCVCEYVVHATVEIPHLSFRSFLCAGITGYD